MGSGGHSPRSETLEASKKGEESEEAAKERELAGLVERGVFEECSREEAWAESGQAPITGKWVTTTRGDRYKARFVVKGFLEVASKEQLTFAPTSALSSVRTVLALAASRDKEWEVLVGDVSQAFLYADLMECKGQRAVFVEPPPEYTGNGGV